MKVALVYDRVNKWGGAERVLLALHRIWPEAPLYTAVYDPKRAAWAQVFKIKTSFLQHFPLAKSSHELYPWLTPLAFETFNFDEFDVVISVTSAEAKGIITKPQTLHICYCLTPTRYLWSGYEQYLAQPGFGPWDRVVRALLKCLAPTLRRWDLVAASRPDYYIAISQRVKQRIEQYYRREVEAVIYPPVSLRHVDQTCPSGWESGIPGGSRVILRRASGQAPRMTETGYFLTVSRLVGYKRVDIIIEAFNQLGWPLVVVGEGFEDSRLRQMAKDNVRFVGGNLTDSELVRYYQNCRAFVYAADEDFGIAAVEAQACGKPVVAFGHSGVAESVIDGKTGILYWEQSSQALMAALTQAKKRLFDPVACQRSAERFATEAFRGKIKAIVERLYEQNKRRL